MKIHIFIRALIILTSCLLLLLFSLLSAIILNIQNDIHYTIYLQHLHHIDQMAIAAPRAALNFNIVFAIVDMAFNFLKVMVGP